MAIGNPLPELCSTALAFAEVDMAIEKTKKRKAAGLDETKNEHLQFLDVIGRAGIHRLFGDLFDHYGNFCHANNDDTHE